MRNQQVILISYTIRYVPKYILGYLKIKYRHKTHRQTDDDDVSMIILIGIWEKIYRLCVFLFQSCSLVTTPLSRLADRSISLEQSGRLLVHVT